MQRILIRSVRCINDQPVLKNILDKWPQDINKGDKDFYKFIAKKFQTYSPSLSKEENDEINSLMNILSENYKKKYKIMSPDGHIIENLKLAATGADLNSCTNLLMKEGDKEAKDYMLQNHANKENEILKLVNFLDRFRHQYDESINNVLIFPEKFESPPVNDFPSYLSEMIATQNLDQIPFSNFPKMGDNMTKKDYEVEVLGSFIVEVLKRINCDLIVDVGAGKGALGNYLLRNSKCRLLEIDFGTDFLKNKDLNRIKFLRENKIDDRIKDTQSVLMNIQSKEDISKVLESCDDFLLVGLHPCGNLTNVIIKSFVANPKCKCQIIVPCCYHLNDSVGKEYEFPLSNLINQREPLFKLSKMAKNLASQSMQRCMEENNDETFMCNLRLLSYRAILQKMISDKSANIEADAIRLGRRNHRRKKLTVHNMESFHEYITWAIGRIGDEKLKNEISSEIVNEYEKMNECLIERLKQVQGWRLKFGLLIESLILLDRYQYLRESGDDKCYSGIKQLFDPVISPRCYCIYSLRSVY